MMAVDWVVAKADRKDSTMVEMWDFLWAGWMDSSKAEWMDCWRAGKSAANWVVLMAASWVFQMAGEKVACLAVTWGSHLVEKWETSTAEN